MGVWGFMACCRECDAVRGVKLDVVEKCYICKHSSSEGQEGK